MPLSVFSLQDILYRLDEREPGVFSCWGKEGGFNRYLAFEPVAQFQLTKSNEKDLWPFLEENQGNLISFLLSYDYGMLLERVETKEPLPEVLGYFYAYPNWLDFAEEEEPKLAHPDAALEERIEAITARRLPREKQQELTFQPSMSLEDYRPQFERIQEYIRSGDIYQINLTQKLSGHYGGSGADLYYRLLQANFPRFAGFQQVPPFEFISMSPESFLETQGPNIYTRPIKGTRPSGETKEEEIQELRALTGSKKEEAELFMITDLLRNDLGKSCQVGSVQVTKQKEIMRLKGVLHSYSEIQGKLKPGLPPFQALLNAFPGGSITGCPKGRAMEIIEELEPSPRGFYTGSFGYLDPKGGLHASIVIRSLMKTGEKVEFHVGGGITLLSELQNEFEEMEHKKNSVLARLKQ